MVGSSVKFLDNSIHFLLGFDVSLDVFDDLVVCGHLDLIMVLISLRMDVFWAVVVVVGDIGESSVIKVGVLAKVGNQASVLGSWGTWMTITTTWENCGDFGGECADLSFEKTYRGEVN